MTTASEILEMCKQEVLDNAEILILSKRSLFDCLKSCLLVCACYPLLPYELDQVRKQK